MGELLNQDIRQQVREYFSGLLEPVDILFFGSRQHCDFCSETRQLVEELVRLSDKLSLDTRDLQVDADLARQYHVDKVPTLVIAGRDGNTVMDYGIRLAGIPSGHEFASLIQTILLVSSHDSGLSALTRDFLKGLSKPVKLQVFVTPT